jgi:hypothetical protein
MPQRNNHMLSVMLGRVIASYLSAHKGARGTTRFIAALGALALLLATGSSFAAEPPKSAAAKACADENTGLTLPPGFCATGFADNIGHAQHLVVAPDGVVYVKSWSGPYYGNDKPPAGGFLDPYPASGKWRSGDGSLASIAQTITNGVPHPKDYGSPMPVRALLTPAQIAATATYIWALSHPNGGSNNAH